MSPLASMDMDLVRFLQKYGFLEGRVYPGTNRFLGPINLENTYFPVLCWKNNKKSFKVYTINWKKQKSARVGMPKPGFSVGETSRAPLPGNHFFVTLTWHVGASQKLQPTHGCLRSWCKILFVKVIWRRPKNEED